MEKCAWCGCEFDVSSAKRSINRKYGVSTYEFVWGNAFAGIV